MPEVISPINDFKPVVISGQLMFARLFCIATPNSVTISARLNSSVNFGIDLNSLFMPFTRDCPSRSHSISLKALSMSIPSPFAMLSKLNSFRNVETKAIALFIPFFMVLPTARHIPSSPNRVLRYMASFAPSSVRVVLISLQLMPFKACLIKPAKASAHPEASHSSTAPFANCTAVFID